MLQAAEYGKRWRESHPGYSRAWYQATRRVDAPLSSYDVIPVPGFPCLFTSGGIPQIALTLFFAWNLMRLSVRMDKENARNKVRQKTNLKYRLRKTCCAQIHRVLKLRGTCKAVKSLALLGCTIEELCAHLEKQFKPGKPIAGVFYPDMTWENHGKVWHIDHIRPCASFSLADPAQQKICFHYTNLQPLFAPENLSKGDKIL